MVALTAHRSQGLNPSLGWELCSSCGNARPFNPLRQAGESNLHPIDAEITADPVAPQWELLLL